MALTEAGMSLMEGGMVLKGQERLSWRMECAYGYWNGFHGVRQGFDGN